MTKKDIVTNILKDFKSDLISDLGRLLNKIENNADNIASLEYLQNDLNHILYTIEKTSTRY